MIQVENKLELLGSLTEELLQLSALPNPSKKQERRSSELMAALSALKFGYTAEEIRHWQQDRLLREAGLLRAPATGRAGWLDEESNVEWHKFTSGQEVRKTYRPPDSESRYAGQLAGQQSILTTQGSKGGDFVAPGMSDRLYNNMKKGDDIFKPEFCNQIDTPTGAVTPFPIWFYKRRSQEKKPPQRLEFFLLRSPRE